MRACRKLDVLGYVALAAALLGGVMDVTEFATWSWLVMGTTCFVGSAVIKAIRPGA